MHVRLVVAKSKILEEFKNILHLFANRIRDKGVNNKEPFITT